MEGNEKMNVPYLVHEGIVVRFERINKRLVIALVLAILLMFASNALWLWAWMQYDYSGEDMTTTTITRTVDVDGKSGVASYIGGSGSIINGTDNSDYDDLYNETEGETENEEEWFE